MGEASTHYVEGDPAYFGAFKRIQALLSLFRLISAHFSLFHWQKSYL